VTYITGGNWVICDVCGSKIRAFHARRRYDGALVCPNDWEPRHLLDYVRGIPDNTAAKVTSPEQPDKFQYQTVQYENGIPVLDEDGNPVQFLSPDNTLDIGQNE
jgi:hypothetical protein